MASIDATLSKMESGDFGNSFHEKQASVYQQQPTSTRINPRIISDATIGLSDGLTVPFALTAGLSALGDPKLVIYGGVAELIAGGISMGLGGYLGAKSEAEAYETTLAETRSIVSTDRERAAYLVRSTFTDYPISSQTIDEMVSQLLLEPLDLVDFLMKHHHRMAMTDYGSSKAYISGLTIASGYFFGGLVPLLPYTLLHDMNSAFQASVIVMILALFTFGWVKTAFLGNENKAACLRSGLQMVMLGGVAAGAAMGCVKAVN